MAETQAVYYRERNGREPVDDFVEALPSKQAAKIDFYVEEYLNGRPAGAPPVGYPITSQVRGELRELRVRFAHTYLRLLYQRSENLQVLLHAFEKDTRQLPEGEIELAERRFADFRARMDATRRVPPRAAGQEHPPRPESKGELLTDFDNLLAMASPNTPPSSPTGARAADAATSRRRRSDEYIAARDEYSAIAELRKVNWIAAHVRERRYELELTQKEVAERARTSHSFISKLESGTHIPTIPVLTRILAVLDERLLIGIEHDTSDGEPEQEIAPAPSVIAA